MMKRNEEVRGKTVKTILEAAFGDIFESRKFQTTNANDQFVLSFYADQLLAFGA